MHLEKRLNHMFACRSGCALLGFSRRAIRSGGVRKSEVALSISSRYHSTPYCQNVLDRSVARRADDLQAFRTFRHSPHDRRMQFASVSAAKVAEKTSTESIGADEQVTKELTLADLPTSDESEALLRIRHSCAHIMAMAVQKLFKGAQCTIGPWIERGFYYDFAMANPITEKDLPKIRKEMQKIIRRKLPFIREDVQPEEARRRINEIGEPYKLEILENILEKDPSAPITIYHIGNPGEPGSWWDLCAGPHVETTGAINPDAIDLESVAGAYWRGNEENAQLQRIYGTAWSTTEELSAYKRIKEEAARR